MKRLLLFSLAILLMPPRGPPRRPGSEDRSPRRSVCHRLSRYLTGACIEDVNHEIYGGLYSQMIFGESFQEPAPGRRR